MMNEERRRFQAFNRSRLLVFSLTATVGLWLILEIIGLIAAWLGGEARRTAWWAFYSPHPYRAFALVPGRMERLGCCSTNRLGLRGEDFAPAKSSETVRIVCMGASTTYSDIASTDSRAYPAQLQALLRSHYEAGSSTHGQGGRATIAVEVLNAGVVAYDSVQVLVYFESKILDFTPNIALIEIGINEAIFLAACPEFESDYNHARSLFGPPAPLWWEHSPFLSLAMRRHATAGNPYWPNQALGMHPFIWKPGAMVATTPEQAQERLRSGRCEAYARNIRNMIYVARGNGVAPVLVTASHNPSDALMGPAVESLNMKMREIAAAENVALLDLAERIPWNPDAFYDQCHLRDSPIGLAHKAKVVADFLIESRLIDDATK